MTKRTLEQYTVAMSDPIPGQTVRDTEKAHSASRTGRASRRPIEVTLVVLVSSLACLAGCQPDEVPVAPPLPSSSSQTVAEVSSALVPPALTSRMAPRDPPPIPMPSPARGRLASAVADNTRCEGCHVAIAKEWRGSYHQRANIDPAFQAAFAIEPAPFCRRCHAPEAEPHREPPEEVSALGVGCVTCHVTEQGQILAAARPNHPPSPNRPPAPHPVRRSVEFASASACANCHEFRFPAPGGQDDAFFMQTTVREHRRSPNADKPCAHCHMPVRRGHRSHAFDEVRNETWLRANLHVTAERTADDTLRVTLTQPDPGHAFPTGDLFRRLEVGYELASAGGKVHRRELRHLARHFEFIPGRPGRHLSRDDRVQHEPKVIELELPAPSEAPASSRLSWWVTYQRVATIGKGTDPNEATLHSEVKLHSGSLPWNNPPTSANEP